MKRIKGTPQAGGERMGSYGNGGSPIGDSAVLCQQLAEMQRGLTKLIRNGGELNEKSTSILESISRQVDATDALLGRVDRASRNMDEAVSKLCEASDVLCKSAETMEFNSALIVKATMTLVYALAPEDKHAEAEAMAERKMAEWLEERDRQKGLRLA